MEDKRIIENDYKLAGLAVAVSCNSCNSKWEKLSFFEPKSPPSSISGEVEVRKNVFQLKKSDCSLNMNLCSQ